MSSLITVADSTLETLYIETVGDFASETYNTNEEQIERNEEK